MLKIKLAPVGKKKQHEYRIVVTEHTKDPWADNKEILGNYNPRTSPSTVTLKKERVEYWLSVGAQPTDTMHNILVDEGIIKADKKKTVTLNKKKREKIASKKADAEAEKEAAEEKPAEAVAPEEAPKEDAPAEPEVKEESKEEEKPAE